MTFIIIKSCLLIIVTSFQVLYAQTNRPLEKTNQALQNYVEKKDSSFYWKETRHMKTQEGTYYEISFISQSWQQIIWKHNLMLYFPDDAQYPHTMLIVLRHLYDKEAGISSLKIISDSTGTPSAMLYDVPNQPLFNGMEEDDLQAYTFSQYIRTGDESWPLLFPMVKSVVRTLDVVQLVSEKENVPQVNDFIVAGHSKRGHATWLTAAVDERVKGIIPIAIDILNSSVQLKHHRETFGEFSTPSKSATDFLKELDRPRGQNLIKMVDAYSYKEQLGLPKLIISASNDDYFTTDALNLYWEGLKGPKWILYLSNANHVRADSDPRINPTAFAFIRAVAAQKSLPFFNWQYEEGNDSIFLKITADSSALKAQLWTSQSNSKDFRQSQWTAQPISLANNETNNKKRNAESSKEFKMGIPAPINGNMAIYGEVEFVQDGHLFTLTTQTYIWGKVKRR